LTKIIKNPSKSLYNLLNLLFWKQQK